MARRSHSAVSIAEIARLKMPPGPAEPAAAAQLGGDHLDPHRVLADAERAQFLDRAFQAAGQRAAEIGGADPDRAVVGLDFEGDDRPGPVRVFGGAGERLIGREGHDIGADAGDFHRVELLPADQVL